MHNSAVFVEMVIFYMDSCYRKSYFLQGIRCFLESHIRYQESAVFIEKLFAQGLCWFVCETIFCTRIQPFLFSANIFLTRILLVRRGAV